MGKWYEAISDAHAEWIREQRLFFVASAASRGYVNVSPKGHVQETFAILGPKQVAYLDMTGSGIETFAISQVDNRITVMFIAFTGSPKIIRLHGRCRCIMKKDVPPDLKARFSEEFVAHKGFRAVVVVDVARVSSSCGYSIPFFDYVKERTLLFETFEKKTEQEVEDYHLLKNSFSLDRLPGLGHHLFSDSRRPVAMRLTDGSGKHTPYAKDGFWWGYADRSFLEAVQEWFLRGAGARELFTARDLLMIALGAAAACAYTRYSPRRCP